MAAGAKTGAEKLLNSNNLRFREPTKIFFPFFGSLPSAFIEDMLCIFKDDIENLANKKIEEIIAKAVVLLNSKVIVKVI